MATRGTVTKMETPAEPTREPNDYVVPVVHIRLPEPAVKFGFYGGLAAAVVLGAVELPLAALVGAGVVIARHRRT